MPCTNFVFLSKRLLCGIPRFRNSMAAGSSSSLNDDCTLLSTFTSQSGRSSDKLVLGMKSFAVCPQDQPVPLAYKILIYLDSLYILWHICKLYR